MSFKKTIKKNTTRKRINLGIERSISAHTRPIPHPESINELVKEARLSPRGSLKNILHTLEKKQKQKNIILGTIPEPLAEGVTDFNLIQNKLCLLTRNAGVATQLRYIKTELLDKLRKKGLWDIVAIEVKVKP